MIYTYATYGKELTVIIEDAGRVVLELDNNTISLEEDIVKQIIQNFITERGNFISDPLY